MKSPLEISSCAALVAVTSNTTEAPLFIVWGVKLSTTGKTSNTAGSSVEALISAWLAMYTLKAPPSGNETSSVSVFDPVSSVTTAVLESTGLMFSQATARSAPATATWPRA
eukprot:gene359-biopygen373